MENLSFVGWLRRQRRRADRVGDLARDYIADASKRPPSGRSLGFDDLHARLVEAHASAGAFEALADADQEYRSRTEGMRAWRRPVRAQ